MRPVLRRKSSGSKEDRLDEIVASLPGSLWDSRCSISLRRLCMNVYTCIFSVVSILNKSGEKYS